MANTMTSKIVETECGYFTGHLANGGVRIGLVDCVCFDFPADHPETKKILAWTSENVESFYDESFAKYAAEWTAKGCKI